jgi:hypothetical protein
MREPNEAIAYGRFARPRSAALKRGDGRSCGPATGAA